MARLLSGIDTEVESERGLEDGGLEPDTCFYIANAHRVVGKRTLDLEVDPAPDVAVEIDLTAGSLSKLPIYAALRVPEIWRYDGNTTHFYVSLTTSSATSLRVSSCA